MIIEYHRLYMRFCLDNKYCGLLKWSRTSHTKVLDLLIVFRYCLQDNHIIFLLNIVQQAYNHSINILDHFIQVSSHLVLLFLD